MSTSVTGLSSDPNKMCKSSFHWRNDSGELDVFEAARYFSTANDQAPGYVNFSQKFIRDDKQHVQRPARRSLDMPMRSNPIPPEFHHMIIMDQNPMKEKKKHKQPSSPGGRLASFLNSLFSQTHLKKKKSKSTKDFEDESPGGRRKRRSSISHFRITSNNTTSAAAAGHTKSSLYSSSSSGFRTPPPYANTPTKSYKEFRKLSDNQRANNGRNFKSTLLDELHAERNGADYGWMEEKLRISNGIPEKIMKNGSFGFSNKISNPLEEEREFRSFNDADDGADSDSSSDLFDLPNHELDFFSSSLPVYETTHMDKIKIAAPISSATTV